VAERHDIQAIPIPASDIAAVVGNPKLINMVLLGALLKVAQVLPVAVVERALDLHLAAHHRGLLDLNRQALRRGVEQA
jgi:2-oxoglutarate ferredoxin oxidoreductase subunit gamma